LRERASGVAPQVLAFQSSPETGRNFHFLGGERVSDLRSAAHPLFGVADRSGCAIQFRFNFSAQPAVNRGSSNPERSAHAFDCKHFGSRVIVPLDPDAVADGFAAGLENGNATAFCFPT
jgi:hypothetical protein